MRTYISIDIETSGLDPETCQVLEIGAVLNDPNKPIRECPTFRACVKHPEGIHGTPRALQMNARLIEEIANGGGEWAVNIGGLFQKWLRQHMTPGDQCLHALGLNVGTFDLVFLNKLHNWPEWLFHYRSLDVNSMYAEPEGMPSTGARQKTIASQLNLPGKPHEAVYDAQVALAMARRTWATRDISLTFPVL
jgi:oligoribonuclease (3'-5' exoribonuclease)